MRELHICPVCLGKGFLKSGFYSSVTGETFDSTRADKCRSCEGKGYLVFEEEVVKINATCVHHAEDQSIAESSTSLKGPCSTCYYGDPLVLTSNPPKSAIYCRRDHRQHGTNDTCDHYCSKNNLCSTGSDSAITSVRSQNTVEESLQIFG